MESNVRQPLLPRVMENKYNWRLEPAIVFIYFGVNLSFKIIPNQLLRQACLFDGFNVTVCSELGFKNVSKEIENKIQPQVADIIMVSSWLTSTIPAILCTMLVPWSDSYGRKKVLCATCIGSTISNFLFAIISSMCGDRGDISPWIYVLPHIPYALSGGWITMMVTILCYTTDLSTDENRSSRLSIVDMIILIGILCGMGSSSYVLQMTSPTVVFMISSLFTIIACFYILVFVTETIEPSETLSKMKQFCAIFTVRSIVEMISTCMIPRPFNTRERLWHLIPVLVLFLTAINGTTNVFYLFVREKFAWTLKDSTTFESSSLMIAVVGLLIGRYVLKWFLKCDDIFLAIVAVASLSVDAIMMAFAQQPYQMYIANILSMFKSLAIPMCRAMIASIIPKHEIGKVYSFVSTFEAFVGMLVSPLYTFVYHKTFMSFPGAFYFITVCTAMYSLYLLLKLKGISRGYFLFSA